MSRGILFVSYSVTVFVIGFMLRGFLDAAPPPSPGIATSAQPAERRAPNDITAAREPVKKAEPAMPAPAGATITGTASATFRPRQLMQPSGDGKPVCSCDDVQVAVTTFKDETGERWQFFSPNADVIDATHKPVLGHMVGEPYKNAIGLTWRPDPDGNVYGVLFQRDVLARLRLGMGLEYQHEDGLRGEVQALIPF